MLISFFMAFAYFSLKKRKTQSSFHCVNLFTVVCFRKNYKERCKEFVFKYCPFLCSKMRGKKKFSYTSKFLPQNYVFYQTDYFVKTTNQN